MKFSFAAILLLASGAEAANLKVKTQAQMQAEIQNMSMNHNMMQQSARERTLIKQYLQVDMNEFFQQKMDSELFAGVDEKQKSEFIGNFFHFVKCRFQDCNLVQTKGKINMHKKSEAGQPSAAVSKKIEDEKNLKDWGSGKGNHVPAHSEGHAEYAQTSSPTAAASKKIEDDKNVKDWGSGKGNHVSAYNSHDKEYVQTGSDKKQKIVTNTQNQVMAELKKEKADELIKPTTKAGNEHDAEPTNVQIDSKK